MTLALEDFRLEIDVIVLHAADFLFEGLVLGQIPAFVFGAEDGISEAQSDQDARRLPWFEATFAG